MDIVERLRDVAVMTKTPYNCMHNLCDAADEIARLRDENESLRGSLEEWKLDLNSLRDENARMRALICDARQEIVSPACNHDAGMQMLDLIERIDAALAQETTDAQG